MVRNRIHETPALGHFNDGVKYWKDLNKLCKRKGWATATLLTPYMGDFNQIIAEYEYPDIATFEKESRAFQADAETMALFRKGPELRPGSWPRSEVLTDVPTLA